MIKKQDTISLSKKSPPQKPDKQSIIKQNNKTKMVSIFALICCLLLLNVAIPHTFSAFDLLYPQKVAQQSLKNSASISTEHYMQATTYIKSALSWLQSGVGWKMLALIQARQIQSEVLSPAELKSQLNAVYNDNRQGLLLSPVDPYSWYRLSVISYMQKAPADKVLGYIQLSCYSGRVEPDLLTKRVQILHQYQALLDDEMYDILIDQIQLAIQLDRSRFIQLAANTPTLLPIIKTALQYRPEQWQIFSTFYTRYVKKNT